MLIHTRCPIDGSDDADRELYAASFDFSQVTPETFSARRRPDRVHYRMVRNERTGCVRADPILDAETLLRLYRESTVTDEATAQSAADTYRRYLGRALPRLPDRRGALEVGCGHGPFLHHLRALDFDTVRGVELSADAVQRADAAVRPHIVQKPLTRDLFKPESFSLVCGFQVLDHLADPNACLQACRAVLAPAGVMFWVCHDIGAIIPRALGKRCPLIDIEHVVLYDRKTLRALFENNGFEVRAIFGIWNRYPLHYWAHLAPLPGGVKAAARAILDWTGLGRWRPRANFGNMGIIAQKPRK